VDDPRKEVKTSLKLFEVGLRKRGTLLLLGGGLLSSKSSHRRSKTDLRLSKADPRLSKNGALILRVRGADASIKPGA
jgi:hypothetical protein